MGSMPAETPSQPLEKKPVARLRTGFVLCGIVPFLVALMLGTFYPASIKLSAWFLHEQDTGLLAVAGAIAAFLAFVPLRSTGQIVIPRTAIIGSCIAIFVTCTIGRIWLLHDYNLSRDEQMAAFDAAIFSSGLLAQPLPEFWRAHAEALNTLFMLPVEMPSGWVSAYLPVNAAFHALIGVVADSRLTAPLMVAVGLALILRISRILWPDDPEAAAIAALLYLLSGQILFTGMTTYAMSGHLALNLLWLWLFLENRRRLDLLALLVGFLATGLHQPLFHPLFALPFIILVWRAKNHHRLALFIVGYVVICAFWVMWPKFMQLPNVMDARSGVAGDGVGYVDRLMNELLTGNPQRLPDMVANLLRFVAWQHILLLPLLLAGFRFARRDPLVSAIAASFVLPIYVMLMILPYQGHGFGYRYLHGVLGSGILLAIFGWRETVRRWPKIRPMFLAASAGTACVLIPMQMVAASSLYRPYALLDARIDDSRADYAILGRTDAPFLGDLVLNAPDLSNRPIRLRAADVNATLIRNLCRPGTPVAMPTDNAIRPIHKLFGIEGSDEADRRLAAMTPRLTHAGCRVVPLR